MLAWQRYRPTAESAVGDAHLSATQRQEQILVEGMEQDVDPGTERPRINRGVTNRLELGQLYLDQRRLEEADQFFGNLAASKVHQYRVLGRLGHGLVLAYQDRPKESNKVLNESLNELKRVPLLANNPVLKYEIARAIGFNKANATPSDPLPAELEPPSAAGASL